jgi:hypothetical protein
LLVKFSRYKTGSNEILFSIESKLLQYSGLGLFIMCLLVLPNLEEVYVLSTLIRLMTLVYPFFFIWSLTRISGVELMQVVFEGRWTAELLSTPLTNRQFTDGFITPVWLVVRQYLLITIFSLALYTLERHVFIVLDDQGVYENLISYGYFYCILFMNTISWIVFVYMARLFTEVRLRNGLIKGLATLFLFMGGTVLFLGYCTLFIRYPHKMNDTQVLVFISFATLFLIVGSGLLHIHLTRKFRHYLSGQLDIDLIVFDKLDPRVSEWTQFENEAGA